jgi:hypothetical protein
VIVSSRRSLQPIEDEQASWQYSCVNSALDGYVAAEFSAAFGDSEQLLSDYRLLLIEALDRARTKIPEARLAYRYHGDMPALMGTAMPVIRHVLEFAAKLLGHCAGLGCSPFDAEGKLAGALERNGLQVWLSVYEADLKAFADRVGHRESFDEFLAFNRHVERVLGSLVCLPGNRRTGRLASRRR